MTPLPIETFRVALTPSMSVPVERTPVSAPLLSSEGPTAEDLQEIGALDSSRQAAGDLAIQEPLQVSAEKATTALDELSAYDGNLSDMLATMAATMVGIFQKLRKSAVEGKVAELKTQVQAMQGQAEKMKEAADKNYSAALVQGWTQFAGAAVGLAGGAVAARTSFKAGQELKLNEGGGASPASHARVDMLNTRSRLATELAQSTGSMITSLGGLVSAGQKHDADLDEAQGKRLEAQATEAAADMAREEEFAQMWKEGLQRVLDNLKAAIDQEQAASKAIIQNI
jgi:hypothetical protein